LLLRPQEYNPQKNNAGKDAANFAKNNVLENLSSGLKKHAALNQEAIKAYSN